MHPKVLSRGAWGTVRQLADVGAFDGWALAGGTALALQFGHRYSEDLDFFRDRSFDVDAKLRQLARVGKVSIQSRSADTLHASVDGLRVSFLHVEAPLLHPCTSYRQLLLADPADIAVMKIIAIGGRGSRKDFVDLYFLLEAGLGVEQIFEQLKKRFERIDYNEYHLLRSLVFFEDAEQEPMPHMIRQVCWNRVKERIVEEVQAFG